ncbi:MAG: hypothetical protein F4Z01_04925 [Gammaproteobacteria bacterium]|nr:hypothetical protein [Gammaproteobacteria bacterium]MYF38115.1 hypothetical protein [Gammaproteobacteria bacterium]
MRRIGKDRGRGPSTPLSYEDFIKLLNICDQPRIHAIEQETARQTKEWALVDRIIISLLFMAGMRCSEVTILRDPCCLVPIINSSIQNLQCLKEGTFNLKTTEVHVLLFD